MSENRKKDELTESKEARTVKKEVFDFLNAVNHQHFFVGDSEKKVNCLDARVLHRALHSKRRFADWIKQKIERLTSL